MSNDDYDDFDEDDEIEREEMEREYEEEVRQHEEEVRQHEEEIRQREEEIRERQKENERRRAGRGQWHEPLPPLPPIPPIPTIPPLPPMPSMRHMKHVKHYHNVNREEEEYFRHRKRKNITIRGLKSDVYESFSNKVQSLNLNLGIVISKMLIAALAKFNGEFPTLSARDIKPPTRLLNLDISHRDVITISRSDLEQSQVRVSLHKIKKVTIEQDVTDELLKKYVSSISECEMVHIPKNLPKLISLSLLNKCQNYEFY